MKRLICLAILGLSVGCGGYGPTTPSAPTAAVFVITETPNPIVASAGSNGFQFAAVFSLAIVESAGMGGNVNFINVTLRDTTTGGEGTHNFSANAIIASAGTNHIAARGTLNIPNLGVFYTLPLGGRQATMTIVVQLGDDAGHTTNQTATVQIV